MVRRPPLHHLFSQRVAQDADLPAVVTGHEALTYRRLAERSGQLARRLRESGTVRGDLVAAVLPRGADLVVAALAAWQAGAVLVPLDPAEPRARLERALEAAGAGRVLTRRGQDLPLGATLRLDLDDPAHADAADESAAEEPAGDEAAEADGPALLDLSDLLDRVDGAGLVLGHAALANQAVWSGQRFGLTAADRVLLSGTATGAAWCWAVFAALAAGGAVVVAPQGAEDDPAVLAAAVVEHAVTVLPLTAAQYGGPAARTDWSDSPSVRIVVCHDPALTEETLLRPTLPAGAQLWHTYGLTRAGTVASAQAVDPAQEHQPKLLGRPVDRVRLLVLDEWGESVPPGVPGELHIAGLGAALDEHGTAADKHAALDEHGSAPDEHGTAARLLADPYAPDGGRMLRTGDLVRWRNNGTLEHLGPVDEDAPGQPVPAAPAPLARPPYVAPATDAERAVAAAWSELLEIDRIGADDNFFQLGGYSLVLTRLAELLHRSTGRRVQLAELFTATTVREQAALVSREEDALPPLVSVPRDAPLPLSAGQRRLWFLDRLEPGSPEWVSPLLVRLPGEYDAETVRRGLAALAARHEVLRTRFVTVDDEPAQVVEAELPVELRIVDCTREELPEHCAEEFRAGFDLAAGRVWRALLGRVAGEEHVLLITLHHIACDGWSTVLLDRELRELCAALHDGRAPELPEPVLQYADFAAWQQQVGEGEQLRADLDYWRKQLDGLPELELPTDRVRPAERDSSGSVVAFAVPAPLAGALTDLGRQHRASPFMTLLTAFSTLVARYSGQWDLPIGTPVAGRTRPEVEPVVGFFLNSLVLRCDLDADLPFTTALERIRDTSREAFAHQELPFDRLVDELKPQRDRSRTPLYQVAFNFHDEAMSAGLPQLGDIELFQDARRIAKTDLTLYVRPEADGSWVGALEYATALFDRGTVERLAGHLVHLLESVAADPGRTLAALDVLPGAERERLLAEWNDTAWSNPATPVIELIEARAAETPDAVALVADGLRVPYRELDERANRLAHHLKALGAGPDRLVGVCLDRGADLVTALLAAWKADAAYVPLDPANPVDRIAHVLADSGAGILVTDSAQAPAAAAEGCTQVWLDRDRAEIAARPADSPRGPVDPEQLAYVIYTSGSTGRPKGVMVTHRGLANHLAWAVEDLLGEGPADGGAGAALFSSFAFDLPATNLFTPLMAGRTAHVLPAGLELTGLGRTLVEGGPYEFLKLTPGHLDLLAHQLTAEEAAALAERIVVAGEALPAALANHWLDLLGPGRLINEYGPTECSVGTTIRPVTAPHSRTVPLGGPLPGATCHILDPHGRLVPVGAVGELYVGGTGVARGYLGRPDLTAEKFVPDPFGPPGARLYRTGDLAVRLADGAIDFLGRIDTQVKIRGYRIELGEIEAVLVAHPDVRDAVVVAREQENGDKALVGYAVAVGGAVLDPALLREHLAAALPEYMVPVAVVPLDAVPLTANGKTDHRALPEPARAAADDDRLPADPIEEQIIAIWRELLGRDRINPDDSFFELGGHSILAIRMTSQIQDEFDIDISVRAIFEHTTVRELAAAVEDHIRAEIEQMSDTEILNEAQLMGEQGA
ncbi:amino acid adenylation domain-containing protein [Kitasatospora sp. NPDC054939]